jgi:hypothetical protein
MIARYHHRTSSNELHNLSRTVHMRNGDNYYYVVAEASLNIIVVMKSGIKPKNKNKNIQCRNVIHIHNISYSKSHSTCFSSEVAKSANSLGVIFSSFIAVNSFSASISPSSTILSPLTTYNPSGTSQYLPVIF